MAEIRTGRYKHYKNKYYQVIGFAHHTETREKMVLYHALYDTPELVLEYGDKPVFTRPAAMFAETVVIDGKEIPRFEYAGD